MLKPSSRPALDGNWHRARRAGWLRELCELDDWPRDANAVLKRVFVRRSCAPTERNQVRPSAASRRFTKLGRLPGFGVWLGRPGAAPSEPPGAAGRAPRRFCANKRRHASSGKTAGWRGAQRKTARPTSSRAAIQKLFSTMPAAQAPAHPRQCPGRHGYLPCMASARIREVLSRMMRGSTSLPSTSDLRTSLPEMKTGFSSLCFSIRSTRPADS